MQINENNLLGKTFKSSKLVVDFEKWPENTRVKDESHAMLLVDYVGALELTC